MVQQQAPVVNIPDSVLAEREARLALSPRDLTAAIAGDPLPGMSALERGQEKWKPVFRPAARQTNERSQRAHRARQRRDRHDEIERPNIHRSMYDENRSETKTECAARRQWKVARRARCDPSGNARGARARIARRGLRARFAGKHASDALAGFTLGVLHLRWQADKNDPGGISPEQFNAAQAWTRIVHRHAAIMGYSLTIRTPSFIMVGRRHHVLGRAGSRRRLSACGANGAIATTR